MPGGHSAGYTDVTQLKTGRPVVRGTQGVVCSGNQLTSMSAMRMLLSGGNAFDAAAAAGFAAAVIEPLAHYSLATEGALMLYQSASNRLIALSGQGVAAGRATVELFKQRGFDKIPTGPGPNAELSFTVPGVVDAFLLMLETYGTQDRGRGDGSGHRLRPRVSQCTSSSTTGLRDVPNTGSSSRTIHPAAWTCSIQGQSPRSGAAPGPEATGGDHE